MASTAGLVLPGKYCRASTAGLVLPGQNRRWYGRERPSAGWVGEAPCDEIYREASTGAVSCSAHLGVLASDLRAAARLMALTSWLFAPANSTPEQSLKALWE